MSAYNQSECTLTETQIRVINIIYTGLSFVSFIVALLSVIFNQCRRYMYKDCSENDPIQGIFAHSLIVSCLAEMFQSFQWFLLLKNSIWCTILGLITEYMMLSMLIVITCLGVHVLVMLTQPKCLRVIKEEKQKIYRKLLLVYIIAAFGLPLLIVPLPFFTTGYGEDEFLCWLSDIDRCTGSHRAVIDNITRTLMWHLWAVLLWIFTIAVVIFAFYRYCFKKPTNTATKVDSNIISILALLITFIVAVADNALVFLREVISERSSFPLVLQAAILTPLALMMFSFILIVQNAKMIRGTTDTTNSATAITSMVTHGTTYGAAQTYYNPPNDE